MVKNTARNAGKYTWTHKSRYKRISHRLRPSRTMMTRSQCASRTNNFFREMPAEVFDMILDKLSLPDISVLTMVSKDLSMYIVDYMSTLSWKNKNIIQSFHSIGFHSTVCHYKHLGLLFKRCTLLLPTKERLKFLCCMFSKIPCFMLERCLEPYCSGFSSYGIFLRTLIAGWDELECNRVFTFLCDTTNLLQKIEAVITAKPGVRWYQEMQLRSFCRQVLLDPWPNQSECQFWLMHLLKPWPIVSQARLLFILYGPVTAEGYLSWEDMVQRELPYSALCELAKVIVMLFSKAGLKGWSCYSMLSIFEELSVIPQPWHVENVAHLLVLCGNSLCYNVLASKALNGRILEISRLIVHIILVCEKDGYHMSWAVKLVQQLYMVFSTAPEKFYFIQHLENMFSLVTKEFFEYIVAGNHFGDRDTFQTLCILLDSSTHFHTKFLHTLLK
ncbi:F-box only protein 47-like [Parambassis ranga]|uniref:F-box only protein 47-like n=1 Tax=Parambassis ranga TaxID=210632 RepID=A0A6P7KM64_9TELE|nr:F-box only protein 47 [Parambassis ranga]